MQVRAQKGAVLHCHKTNEGSLEVYAAIATPVWLRCSRAPDTGVAAAVVGAGLG